jgi:integrase
MEEIVMIENEATCDQFDLFDIETAVLAVSSDKIKLHSALPDTFGALFEHYVANHASLQKRTADKDIAMYRLHIAPHLAVQPLNQLNGQHIGAMLLKARSRGLTTQANRLFSLVRAVINYGGRIGVLESHRILQGMKRPVREVPRERDLQSHEMRAIVNALWQTDATPDTVRVSKAIRLALQFLLITSQRVGEVAGIARAEIDLKACVWHLPAERAKNGKSHKIPLSTSAISVVYTALALEPNSSWLFPSPIARLGRPRGTQPVTSTSMNHAFTSLLRHSPLHDVHLHDLREAAATYMAEVGIPVRDIAAVLNHSQGSVTEKAYIRHSYAKEKRRALQQWAVHIDILRIREGMGL